MVTAIWLYVTMVTAMMILCYSYDAGTDRTAAETDPVVFRSAEIVFLPHEDGNPERFNRRAGRDEN